MVKNCFQGLKRSNLAILLVTFLGWLSDPKWKVKWSPKFKWWGKNCFRGLKRSNLAILLVTFLGWLSDLKSKVKWSPMFGDKKVHFESPGQDVFLNGQVFGNESLSKQVFHPARWLSSELFFDREWTIYLFILVIWNQKKICWFLYHTKVSRLFWSNYRDLTRPQPQMVV